MGGRNGGAMGKSKVDKVKAAKKNKVVTMPRTNTGEDAEASGNGEEKDAAEKIEEEDHKGARKALRQAVKTVVKGPQSQDCRKASGEDRRRRRALRSDGVVADGEEEEKDGEDDNWDGPGLADIWCRASRGKRRPRQKKRRMTKRKRRRRRKKAVVSCQFSVRLSAISF